MELHISVNAETLFELGPLHVTNSFLTMLLIMALIIIVGAMIARRASVERPGRVQGIFEMVVEFLLNIVEGAAGKRLGRRAFPLVGALFFFIILANYSGLLPGIGTIGFYEDEEEADEAQVVASASSVQYGSDVVFAEEEAGEEHHEVLVPFFRSPNADLNMTLAMAFVTFTVVQIAGVSAHGVGGRIKHMADPPFLLPIELISEFARIISLSFRLFGNIFAGEVLVTVMVTMAATLLEKTYWTIVPLFLLPTIFLVLEVLFGFIQALIFSLLTLAYISLSAAESHDEHDGEHGHAAGHGERAALPAAAGGH